jgi:hypothetical protein
MPFNTLTSGASAFFHCFTRNGWDSAAYPPEEEQELDRAHGRAPSERHLDFLQGDISCQ